MKTVWLVRHGQSEANAGGISRPERDIRLSPQGRQQAEEAAARLPAGSRVFVSEMRRTHETAAPYCLRHGLRPEVQPLLNEFSCLSIDLIRGMDGAARRPLAQAYWQRADIRERTGPGADTFAEFDKRVTAFLAQWPELPDHCILFGHGIWIGLLAWKLLGFPANSGKDMAAFRRFQTALPMPNAGIWQLSGNGTMPLNLKFQG